VKISWVLRGKWSLYSKGCEGRKREEGRIRTGEELGSARSYAREEEQRPTEDTAISVQAILESAELQDKRLEICLREL